MRNSPSNGLRAMGQDLSRRLPQPNSDVVFCEVDEGAVLLSTGEEAYYGLNAVGARVWLLLPKHDTYEGLCTELSASYPDVELGQLSEDVSALIGDLQHNGLVKPL